MKTSISLATMSVHAFLILELWTAYLCLGLSSKQTKHNTTKNQPRKQTQSSRVLNRSVESGGQCPLHLSVLPFSALAPGSKTLIAATPKVLSGDLALFLHGSIFSYTCQTSTAHSNKSDLLLTFTVRTLLLQVRWNNNPSEPSEKKTWQKILTTDEHEGNFANDDFEFASPTFLSLSLFFHL